MDKRKLKTLYDRVKLASNATVAAIFAVAGLLFTGTKLDFSHASLAVVLGLVGAVVYAATTWILMEMSVSIPEGGNEEDDD